MHILDWIVMLGTLLGIVAYGIWKTRNISSVQSYLKGDRDLPWWTIGLSIMATQASAITFLSTPGQAYEDGMRFVQFYYGMPLAMVLLSIFVLPHYYRLNVYTAYEFLEGRFGVGVRTLTAILFLIQRGLSAGITIYAPAIVMSAIFGWNLNVTILFTGGIVILYTVIGGTKAVSVTQKQQMIVMLGGLFIAAVISILKLPEGLSFGDALGVAGKLGKLDVADFSFDLSNRYNVWSGVIGALFLFMSYFGTDQSQVQRYLSGKSLKESRMGLLFNGIFKIPMQFLILFVGIMVFIFFQFTKPPLHFNQANVASIKNTSAEVTYQKLESEQTTLFQVRQEEIRTLVAANRSGNEAAALASSDRIKENLRMERDLRKEASDLIKNENPEAQTRDTDYVFITFVTQYMPVGLIGLLLAVIFCAAMSSTASELTSLATTTVIDIYRRSFVKNQTDHHYFLVSKWFTFTWGIIALLFAASAGLFENLIQLVNIVGSIFYGVILGIFFSALFLKYVRGTAVFLAALLSQALVIGLYILDKKGIFPLAFLWFNLIGCAAVMLFALFIQLFIPKKKIT